MNNTLVLKHAYYIYMVQLKFSNIIIKIQGSRNNTAF